ncbi:hypothetical protein JNL27_14610 [bacterium]|nr:hypothetical protein [bacterium]
MILKKDIQERKKMLIAVPSKNRAGLTTTEKILKSAVFFVPENEAHNYEKFLSNEVVKVPNNVRGITPTRNWILRNNKEKRVVFIDDDVKRCGWVKMKERNAEYIEIKTETFWINEWMKLFDVCEQMNYKMWGLKTEGAPRSVYPNKPFNFKRYITASCMGIINDGEYLFDERFVVKEDYEIGLRHMRDKGGVLGVNYIYWENEHWDKEGGCKDYRTIDVEIAAIKLLNELYPGMIRKAKRKANKFTIQLT